MEKFFGLVYGWIIGTFLVGMMWLGTNALATRFGWIPAPPAKVADTPPPGWFPRATSGMIEGVIVTAYDGHDKECIGAYRASLPEPHVTAKSVNVDIPGFAADFDVLPPGTEITIPALGISYLVDDTGQAMQDDAARGIYHIDLRIPADYASAASPEEARRLAHVKASQFGVQILDIIVKLPDGR